MPQIKTSSLTLGVLLSMLVFSLSGCGDTNSQAVLDTSSGKHPTNWLPAAHKDAATKNIEACAECHGADFSGGIAKVSCTKCHLGDEENVHPLDWDGFAYVRHSQFVAQKGTSACANVNCHGANLTGVASSGPSCTSCHIGGLFAVHPWTTFNDFSSGRLPRHGQYVLGATGRTGGTASCRNDVCHGANLQGVLASGPPCSACHFGTTFP